ncbi:MAG TPA: hypothetical protein VGF99_12085 [Myxococcota bacterium]
MSARSALIGLGLVALATGCRQPTVAVEVVFPSSSAFLHAAVARIDVYDGSDVGDRSPAAICRSLSTNPPAPPSGVQPLASSGNTEICAFRAGGVTLPAIGVGRRVVFVEAEDFAGQAIMRGCSVVDIFGDDDTALAGDDAAIARDLEAVSVVEVPVAILPAFPAGPAGCQSITEKCEEGLSCRPEP